MDVDVVGDDAAVELTPYVLFLAVFCVDSEYALRLEVGSYPDGERMIATPREGKG